MTPLAESYVSAENLNSAELFYPLDPKVCEKCWLVQLDDYVSPRDIFNEYAYFSSYSDSWVEHAKSFVDSVVRRFALTNESRVFEIASNDGYLLQHFQPYQIPAVGIEPARNVAEAATQKKIPTVVAFFGAVLADKLRSEYGPADLIIANNVLAQVPDLHDFTSGLRALLKKDGVITLEFPHLSSLLAQVQFDTIYHEHFSYFSFSTVEQLFARHDLRVFAVEKLLTHGGSLRVYVCHADDRRVKTYGPEILRREEARDGVNCIETYRSFENKVRRIKRELLKFLIGAQEQGKTIAGYGAPGKGNILLNYCGIRTDLLEYTVDRNPYKQGKYLPGVRIPIFVPEKLTETKPELIFILPWNLRTEILSQLRLVCSWGPQFLTAIPELAVSD
jgi:hypothetical protein